MTLGRGLRSLSERGLLFGCSLFPHSELSGTFTFHGVGMGLGITITSPSTQLPLC